MSKAQKKHILRRKFIADLKWAAENPGADLLITSKEARAILELLLVVEAQ